MLRATRLAYAPAWHSSVEAAFELGSPRATCEALIEIRRNTEVVSKRTVWDHLCSANASEGRAAAAASHPQRHTTFLEGADGKAIDPSTALRIHRQGIVGTYFSQKLKTRHQRWLEASTAMAATRDLPSAGSETTVHAGEVWLLLCAVTLSVAMCVIIGAYKQLTSSTRTACGRRLTPRSRGSSRTWSPCTSTRSPAPSPRPAIWLVHLLRDRPRPDTQM